MGDSSDPYTDRGLFTATLNSRTRKPLAYDDVDTPLPPADMGISVTSNLQAFCETVMAHVQRIPASFDAADTQLGELYSSSEKMQTALGTMSQQVAAHEKARQAHGASIKVRSPPAQLALLHVFQNLKSRSPASTELPNSTCPLPPAPPAPTWPDCGTGKSSQTIQDTYKPENFWSYTWVVVLSTLCRSSLPWQCRTWLTIIRFANPIVMQDFADRIADAEGRLDMMPAWRRAIEARLDDGDERSLSMQEAAEQRTERLREETEASHAQLVARCGVTHAVLLAAACSLTPGE